MCGLSERRDGDQQDQRENCDECFYGKPPHDKNLVELTNDHLVRRQRYEIGISAAEHTPARTWSARTWSARTWSARTWSARTWWSFVPSVIADQPWREASCGCSIRKAESKQANGSAEIRVAPRSKIRRLRFLRAGAPPR